MGLARTGAFEQRVIGLDQAALDDFNAEAIAVAAVGPTALEAIQAALAACRAEVVVIHGDGHLALIAGIAAARGAVAIVRVGAASAPDSPSAVLDRLADLVLVRDAHDTARLAQSGIGSERVIEVGNPLADAVRCALHGDTRREVVAGEQRRVLVVLAAGAPPAALDAPLAKLAAAVPVGIVGRCARALEGALAAGAVLENPTAYSHRVELLHAAGAIVTDSRRAMEEAGVIGVPCHVFNLAGPVPPHVVSLGEDLPAIAAVRPEADPRSRLVGAGDARAGRRIAAILVANFARVRLA